MNQPNEPPSHGPEKRYFDALDRGVFEIQRCGACGRHVFQPRVRCPVCGGGPLDWVAPSGRGVVHSTTVVRKKKEAGGDYNVALVDLEEGVRMMSRVGSVAPEAVTIGMPVAASVEVVDGRGRVVFAPRQGDAA